MCSRLLAQNWYIAGWGREFVTAAWIICFLFLQGDWMNTGPVLTCSWYLRYSTLSIESKEKIMERACQIQEVPYDTICIYLLRGVKLGAVTQARDLKMFFMNGGWTIWPCHLLSFSTSITTVTNTEQPEHHDYTMKWRKSPVTIFIFIDAKTWVMAHKVTWGWCSMNTRLIWVFKIC